MKRAFFLGYGILNYVCFLAVFLYLLGFIGGIGVPTKLDGNISEPWYKAALINLCLVAVFGIQHSVMARPGFKTWWMRIVPEPIERSTYVLFTNLALALLFWQWRPMGVVIWDLQEPVLRVFAWSLFALGAMIVLVTTFLINHFDLFGLRQVWMYFRQRTYQHLPFATPGPYRIVRHPLYVGWLLTFWATPTMTAVHLLFSVAMTVYILVAIPFEERDLARFHAGYAEYRRRVPMLIPGRMRSVEHPNLDSSPRPVQNCASAGLQRSTPGPNQSTI